MDAERAAAKIVAGVLTGRAYVVLTPLAQLGMRLNGVAPTVTAALMALGGRLLPTGPDHPTSTGQGYQVRQQMRTGSGRVFRFPDHPRPARGWSVQPALALRPEVVVGPGSDREIPAQRQDSVDRDRMV